MSVSPEPRTLLALLVDPSLFTAPYDGALSAGLVAVGVTPLWAVRPLRPGDRQEIATGILAPLFYRHVDQMPHLRGSVRAVLKGLSHAGGLARLIHLARRRGVRVVHFQWLPVPLLDTLSIALLRRRTPVVLTVHDTVPFNGDRVAWLQRLGFDLPLWIVDGIIVHTRSGRDALVARGISASKIRVIPHGPLALPGLDAQSGNDDDPVQPWRFSLFGEMKHYKGIDLLIEAVGCLPREVRQRARFVVAGRARLDLAPLRARIKELGLEESIELRDHRHSEQDMIALFRATDCFLFPYRRVDSSGVYFLTKPLGKWLIATRVGVFAEDVQPEHDGELIQPGDVEALARAISFAVINRPRPHVQARPATCTWAQIGAQTQALYEELIDRSPCA